MRDYDSSSYGDGFADVYDDWYRDISDIGATVDTLVGLAGDLPVLELGVGTGRIAVPLAGRGVRVVGVDTSEAMLERLRAKPGGDLVEVTRGDMTDDLPPGPFGAIFVAYNTFFANLSAVAQQRCFDAVAGRLAPGGRFVVEAFVPTEPPLSGSDVSLRSMTRDLVVLSVSVHDPVAQIAEGHYIEISEAGGVRLRPWVVRYATPAQLDEMATNAGLTLERRDEDWRGTRFDELSVNHVSVWARG